MVDSVRSHTASPLQNRKIRRKPPFRSLWYLISDCSLTSSGACHGAQHMLNLSGSLACSAAWGTLRLQWWCSSTWARSASVLCRVCVVSSDTNALSDVGTQASIHTSPGCHAPQRRKDDLQLHVTTLINDKTRACFEVHVQQDACASALPCSAERQRCPVKCASI